jgi:hypothetical protein
LVFNDQKIIKIRGNQPLEVFLKTFDELWFYENFNQSKLIFACSGETINEEN